MISIFAGRAQLLGDCISSLSLLNIVKNKYPNSKIYWPVAQKAKSAIPFIHNHPLIDSVILSDDIEGNIYTINSQTYNQQTDKLPFDVQINCNPPARPNWYNEEGARLVKENCLMAAFSEEDFEQLTEKQKIPELNWTEDIVKFDKPTVAVHVAAGYGGNNKRTPNIEWWQKLIGSLPDYDIVQIGHPSEVSLNKIDIRKLDLIDQFSYVLGSSVYIGVEGGLAWINAAMGYIPQINLMTYHMPNHHTNPLAWSPTTQLGNEINLFHEDINQIPIEKVKESLEILLQTR